MESIIDQWKNLFTTQYSFLKRKYKTGKFILYFDSMGECSDLSFMNTKRNFFCIRDRSNMFFCYPPKYTIPVQVLSEDFFPVQIKQQFHENKIHKIIFDLSDLQPILYYLQDQDWHAHSIL